MTKKIVFIGNSGVGKTTLTEELSAAFKKMGFNTALVSEWVRGDIVRNGPMENVHEQFRILKNQRDQEDYLPEEVEYAIIDSGCLTGYFYAALYSSKENRRDRLAIVDLYRSMLDDLYIRRYDHIFFIPRKHIRQIGAKLNDGVRYQTDEEHDGLEDFMTLFLTRIHRMDNLHVLDCALGDRIRTVTEIVLGTDGAQKLAEVAARDAATSQEPVPSRPEMIRHRD